MQKSPAQFTILESNIRCYIFFGPPSPRSAWPPPNTLRACLPERGSAAGAMLAPPSLVIPKAGYAPTYTPRAWTRFPTLRSTPPFFVKSDQTPCTVVKRSLTSRLRRRFHPLIISACPRQYFLPIRAFRPMLGRAPRQPSMEILADHS